MKKISLTLLLLLVLITAGCGPAVPAEVEKESEPAADSLTEDVQSDTGLEGEWQGSISILGQVLEIRMVFENEAAASGTIWVISQSNTAVELHDISFTDGQVHFEMLSGSRLGVFEGTFTAEDQLEGIFTQAGQEGSFALQRSSSSAEAAVSTETPESESPAQVFVPEQDLTGEWKGNISILGQVLEIKMLFENENSYSGTIWVISQSNTPIELHDISFSEEEVHFEMLADARLGVFEGIFLSEDQMEGTFTQVGQEGSFELQRYSSEAEDAAAAELPYLAEEVSFVSGDLTLAGTLTLPKGEGPFPALVLVSGSGPQDRNEEIAGVPGYRPFEVIADELSRQGVAVLRYDDRGVGQSEGNNATANTEDLSTDAQAAFDYLLTREEINTEQVGILGHSEGAMIAAMLAAENPQISFIVSLAGIAADSYEALMLQNELLVGSAGFSEEEVEAKIAEARQMLDWTLAEDWESMQTFLEETLTSQIGQLSDEQKTTLGDEETYIQMTVEAYLTEYQVWISYYLKHDWQADWEKVQQPALAVFGGLDKQVEAELNRSALEETLLVSGNQNVEIVTFPKANHLFQEAVSGSTLEYPTLSPEFLDGFIETLTTWVVEQTGAGK